jgi:hypothetical protein
VKWAIPKWSDVIILPEDWVLADEFPFTDPADIDTPFDIINTSSPELALRVLAAMNGEP